MLNHPFDTICISETRIHEDLPLSNIDIDKYTFYHTPTSSQCGGVGIYIKSSLECELLKSYSTSHPSLYQSIFLEIKNKTKKNIIIGCVYRHPSPPISNFSEEYFDSLLMKITKLKKTCIITGDFNIDLIKYNNSACVSEFYDQISSYGFRPLILQPSRFSSRSATLIDNIFINDLSCFSNGGNITTSISDHLMQFTQLDILDHANNNKSTKKVSRNWRVFNSREFQEELSQIQWPEMLDPTMNTNQSFSTFFERISNLLDEMAPMKTLAKKQIRLSQKPWITSEILFLMKKRDIFYNDFCKEKDNVKKERLNIIYKHYRNKVVCMIRNGKNKYYTDFFNQYQSNAKQTWKGIRDILNVSKKSKISINKIIFDKIAITESKKIAETLNTFFVNMGSTVEAKIPCVSTCFKSFLKAPNPNTIFLNPCNSDEIIEIIKKFSTGKATGPFSIPTNLLIEFPHQFSTPLVILINKSLEEGCFPNLLKSAIVCPIFKKNDKTNCANYRPISLLSNIGKIFERIMYNRIEKFLDHSNSIYDFQFGFRKKYSTNHALLSITEKIREYIDDKKFACGVFVDLENAFDTVNHAILISKLENYGIRNNSNKWIASYLENRSQKVTLDGITSKSENITCGVPQGSILGPLLFIIYINDMHNALKQCIVHHFADDTNLLYSHSDPKILKRVMNSELKILFDWLCANRLSLNVAKTEFIIFRPSAKPLSERIVLRLNQTNIYESTKIRYLGLILDSCLSWKHHINELCKKLSRAIGLLYKIKHFSTKHVLRSLYFSIFHSHLTYGLPVWGNAAKFYINKQVALQKRAIRAINSAEFNAHTEPLFKKSGILKLIDQRHVHTCSILWDLDKDQLPPSLSRYFVKSSTVHHHNTRHADTGKYCIKKTNTTFGNKSFQVQGSLTLNNLKDDPVFCEASSKANFIKKLKNSFLENYENH